jgi:hypothetical protein
LLGVGYQILSTVNNWTQYAINMSFVFDKDEDCWSKINTWGHSHQYNITEWYNKYWLNWTPELINIHPIQPIVWHKTVEFKGKLPEVLR